MIEVVAGSTEKDLVINFVYPVKHPLAGQPRDLAGYVVRMQGESESLTGNDVDVLHSFILGGTVYWYGFGGELTPADLGVLPGATYVLRAKFTGATGKIDYGPEFEYRWVAPPI